jgi:uncharacterized protein YsxB (DUF464 family)
MVEITFSAKDFMIKAEGHANSDEEGKDIVCASVSTLLYTLKDSLEHCLMMLETDTLKASVKKGNAFVRCVPKEAYMGNIEMIYWVILNGCYALAESYPDYVTFTEVG